MSQLTLSVYENIVRTAMVCFTVMVAIRLPFFGAVLGAVGGLTDTLQAFVIPSMIFLVMAKDNGLRAMFYRMVMLIGVGIMMHTIQKLIMHTM
jgi:hypothetical protein